MTAIENHRREIAEKLRAGANVHESMARLCRNEDVGAEAYHMDMAQVMREAATMIQEREACLLSLADYKAISEWPVEGRVPVWLEWRGGSGRWTIPERAYQGYGVNWRCWTGKPSNEQRRAETWT